MSFSCANLKTVSCNLARWPDNASFVINLVLTETERPTFNCINNERLLSCVTHCQSRFRLTVFKVTACRWKINVWQFVILLAFKQELSSCSDGRPFGHNRHVPKSGGLLYPFPWEELGPHNTLSPGPRPISVPSGILIYPTVWPQYTNVTDRQTDRQRSDSIVRTLLQTVAQKSLDLKNYGLSNWYFCHFEIRFPVDYRFAYRLSAVRWRNKVDIALNSEVDSTSESR